MNTIGNTRGRPRTLTPRQEARLIRLHKQGWTYKRLAEEFGFSSTMSSWMVVNRDLHVDYYRTYRDKNRKRLKQYYDDNKEDRQRRCREYYWNNVDRMRKYFRDRYAANPEYFKEKHRRYLARKKRRMAKLCK
jgi:hypothetical protein